MITISLTTAVVLYSLLLLVGAVAVWVWTEIGTQRAYRVLEKQDLWRCAYCRYLYLDTGSGEHSACPRCGSINIAEEAQDRLVRRSKERQAALQPDPDPPEQEQPRRNPSRRKRPGASGRGPRRRR